MTDLNKALVRSAPRAPASIAEKTTSSQYPVTVEVCEPDDKRPLPALPSPSSHYRIPRLPLKPDVPAPRVHRLSKKKAAVLADKVAKRERKQRQKKTPRHKRFCKTCQISCNSATVFYDHINSRSHRLRVENKKRPPFCVQCNRNFESHIHLNRHKNGAAHLKVVTKLSQ